MSNMNTTDYAADQHGRPDTSKVPGTGTATGPGTLGGVHASELGSDRSGTKTEDFTSGIEGTPAAHPVSNTSNTSGHHQPHTSLGGHDHAQSRGAATSSGSVNPSTTGTSSNTYNRDDTLNRDQHGRSGEGLPGAAGVSSVGEHHKHGSDTHGQHGEHAFRSSTGGASHAAGGLGGATATPQQQTMAGHKDASVVAASQPTTHETGSMLDVGDVPTPAHQTSSHQPTHAGQTHTDSARAGDNVHPNTGRDVAGRDATGRDSAGQGHTGRDATGMAAAGAAAAYAAHHHDQHSHGSSPSTSRPVGSGIDPAHSDARARDTAHSSGGPLHSHQNQLDNPSGINQSTSVPGQNNRLDNTRSGHADHTARDAALGAGAAGAAGYGAHEHNKHKHNTGLDTSSSRTMGSTGVDPAHTDSRDVAGSGHHGPLSGRDHTARDAALGAGATGAAGYGAHEHHKHHGQGSSASHPVGSGIDPTHADSRTSVGTEHLGSQSGHGGHTSRDAALGAGAVGGAAAYGAHEHNKHKDRDTLASGPAGSGTNPTQHDPRSVAGSEFRDSQVGHGNHSTADTALAGAGAAGAGYGASRLARHHNEPSIGQSGDGVSGVGSNTSNLSSQTSPSQGQYNSLSGGTPSGIAAGSHAGASAGPQTSHGVSDSAGYTGNSHVGSGSGPYSSLTSGTSSGIATGDHQNRSIGHDSGVGHSGLKGSAAAAAEQLRSTGRVTHKCQNCNEDMDISKHFTSNH
ncbi:hypothetical protein BJ166DRAFT_500945 [Pestalotiopsis sp. NC0098]|nr:hypothetical protein BJ166DRAFT_500945 [Pestalotiopsis sp. NC0098]